MPGRQLVIELVGKADKYVKSLGDAEKATHSWGDKVESAGKKATAFVSVPIVGFLAAGAKAAVDDAAAQDHLAKTLENTIGNSKKLVTQVEDYIGKAMKASTFTDDELRPAFETLVTTTKDLDKSQRLMSVAMDVAAAKGISLEAATNAVAKASEGQFTAVNRLVPGLIDTADKTLTADQAVAQLARTFNGQAAAATDTTAGKMKTFSRDIGETAEKLGGSMLPAITKVADFLTNTLIPTLDKVSGGNGALVLMGVAAAGPVMSNIVKLKNAIVGLNLTLDATAVKAAAALGAIGIVIQGIQTIKNTEGGVFEKILGPSGVSRFLDRNNPFGGGKAAGGSVSGGTSYLVGERGPELFTPGRSGSITPNHALGGVTVVVQGSVITERDLGRVFADAMRDNALIGVS